MSPLDKAVLRRKLEVILENLNALEPICEMTKEDYLKDIFKEKRLSGCCRSS